MRARPEELRRDVATALRALGAPEEEAEVGAEMCVDAELRGHVSHGVRLLRNVAAEYERGTPRRRPVETVRESPVSAQVDGGFHLSWYVHRLAVDLAVSKAVACGMAVVSVRNAGVSGALGYLAERMASAGLIGLALNSTPATVVAPGGSVPALGTNPVAVAVPRRTGSPLVLDMATSSIAFNEILRRRDSGLALPDGVAAGGDGASTTDPDEAVDPTSGRGRILPFGGHRGFGLALMVELLVAAGASGRSAGDKRGPVVLEPADFSALYLAYQPGLVGDPEEAAAATERLLEELSAGGSRLPGEQSRQRRRDCLDRDSVEVDPAALDLVASLVGRGRPVDT